MEDPGVGSVFASVPPTTSEKEEGAVFFSAAGSFVPGPAVMIMPWISQGREVEMLVAPGGSLTT